MEILVIIGKGIAEGSSSAQIILQTPDRSQCLLHLLQLIRCKTASFFRYGKDLSDLRNILQRRLPQALHQISAVCRILKLLSQFHFRQEEPRLLYLFLCLIRDRQIHPYRFDPVEFNLFFYIHFQFPSFRK